MKTITGILGDEPKSYQMEVMTCKEYNARQRVAYDKAVEKWKGERGNNIIPQIAFFYFWNDDGSMHENGFVAVAQRRHIWADTEDKAERKMRKEIGV